MELHIIRHGETNWNAEGRAQSHMGSHLTITGKKQASELSAKIKNIQFEKIYSSSSLRTRQTSELIWPDRIKEIIYLDELREIYLGPWEGQLYSKIAEVDSVSHHHFFTNPHLFSLEGAETFKALSERAEKSINKIYQANKGRLVALVGHGAFIKALMTKIEGKELSQIWDPPFMHNCAHNIINYTKGCGTIIQFADKIEWL